MCLVTSFMDHSIVDNSVVVDEPRAWSQRWARFCVLFPMLHFAVWEIKVALLTLLNVLWSMGVFNQRSGELVVGLKVEPEAGWDFRHY